MSGLRRWWSAGVLWCGLLACEDAGSIGSDRCVGAETRCDSLPADESLPIDTFAFPKVGTAQLRELEVVWSRDLVCRPACQRLRVVAAADGLWLVRALAPDGLRVLRYGEGGDLSAEILLDAPDDDGSYEYDVSPPVSDGAGGLVVHVNWLVWATSALPPSVATSEVIQIDAAGVVTRTPLPWKMQPPVFSHGVLPHNDGFLLYQSNGKSNMLRQVDAQGETEWQQVTFPEWIPALGVAGQRSLLALEDGFIVSAFTNASSGLASLGGGVGLVRVDAAGNVTRSIRFTTWPVATRLAALSANQFAMAGNIPEAAPSGLPILTEDLYVFRLDDKLAMSGVRIVRETYAALDLSGFAGDERGDLYVSSRVGARDDERGLLCRVPQESDAVCYQTEPALLLYDIVPSADGHVYAVSEEKLLRLRLPQD
jgi:hypothetical protein